MQEVRFFYVRKSIFKCTEILEKDNDPFELNFLMHIKTSAAEFLCSGTELYALMTDCFLEEGIIVKESNRKEVESGFELTDLGAREGKAWTEVILHVPKPKLCFVDYSGRIVSAL